MSMLKEAFEAGKFGVTAEMAPPKGYDFSEQLEAAKLLNGKVHGVNLRGKQPAGFQLLCKIIALRGRHLGSHAELTVFECFF